MDELLAWLEEQVATDERIATAAGERGWWSMGKFVPTDPVYDWRIKDPDGRACGVVDANGGTVVHDEGAPSEDEAVHIAHFDPRHQLDDVVAKRAMLSAYTRALEHVAYVEPRTSANQYESMLLLARSRVSEWERVVRLLAVAYVSRDGFREAWRTA